VKVGDGILVTAGKKHSALKAVWNYKENQRELKGKETEKQNQ